MDEYSFNNPRPVASIDRLGADDKPRKKTQARPRVIDIQMNSTTLWAFDETCKNQFVNQGLRMDYDHHPFVGLSEHKKTHLVKLVQWLANNKIKFQNDIHGQKLNFHGGRLVVRYNSVEPQILNPMKNTWEPFTFGRFVDAYLYLC